MRSFGSVLDKLNETQFYLHLFARSWNDEKAGFYFSAFASAARSVSFVIQAVCKSLPGFETWYAGQRKALRADPVAQFLLAARNETQKVGIAPVRHQGQVLEKHGAGRHYCFRRFGFVALESGVMVPNGNAAELCRNHVVNLAAMVASAYEEFRGTIDPKALNVAIVKRAVRIRPLKAPRCPLDRLLRAPRRGPRGAGGAG